MLLDELFKFIPSDTEVRVRRTRDRFNQNLREVLRQETGLRLRRSVRDRDQVSLFGDVGVGLIADQITVKVELVPGLPSCLRERPIEDKHRLAALIAPWKDSLENLRDSAKDVQHLVEMLWHDPAGHPIVGAGLSELPPVIDLSERLLRQASEFNLAEWILNVNEDVLGTYRYYVPNPRQPFQRKRQDPWIELYWGVIGLFSRLLLVAIEDLTIVVLAHELAHAYTHVGCDIDGHSWSSEAFSCAERELTEGLAQHYAAAVCQRLALSAPKALGAFERLLKELPSPYRTHIEWTKKSKPEELRLALLQVRRSGTGSHAHFEHCLDMAKVNLRHVP